MPLFQGFVQLGAGLSVGLAGLAAGFAIGIVGDAGVRGTGQQPRLFVGMACPWFQAAMMCFANPLFRSLSSFSQKSWVSTVSPIPHFMYNLFPLTSSCRSHCCTHHEHPRERCRWNRKFHYLQLITVQLNVLVQVCLRAEGRMREAFLL